MTKHKRYTRWKDIVAWCYANPGEYYTLPEEVSPSTLSNLRRKYRLKTFATVAEGFSRRETGLSYDMYYAQVWYAPEEGGDTSKYSAIREQARLRIDQLRIELTALTMELDKATSEREKAYRAKLKKQHELSAVLDEHDYAVSKIRMQVRKEGQDNGK